MTYVRMDDQQQQDKLVKVRCACGRTHTHHASFGSGDLIVQVHDPVLEEPTRAEDQDEGIRVFAKSGKWKGRYGIVAIAQPCESKLEPGQLRLKIQLEDWPRPVWDYFKNWKVVADKSKPSKSVTALELAK